MTKAEIVANISDKLGIEKVDVQLTVESLMQEIINKMEKESKNFNIESTPTFIINNNHKISGALSFKDFEKELLTLIKAKNS